MPLLERKVFKRVKPPQDLDPNEDLFYCKATQEVFRQYEQFFERVILCNSLVWTCSMTGKSNMTFQEAVESEESARNSLRTFPLALKKPLLYLTSLTNRSRLNDMCDDVFNYVKDRYFVGEEVEVSFNGTKKSCEVTQVVLPDKPAKSPAKSENKPVKQKDIAPAKIKYEVVDYNSGKTSVVKADAISRPKGTFTKPRNKLYLKHHTHMKDGVFKVKDSVSAKMQISEFPFNEVFPGPLPGYAVVQKKESADKKSKNAINKKVVQGKLNFKKESMDERRKNLEKMALTEKQKIAIEKERQKVKDNLKKQMEDVKLKQKEEKLKEKEKKKEEKKKIAEYLNNWKKPRDDLECDDLKDLPSPTPIDCDISQDCFGDALMILEFLNTFSKQVQLKDIFPHGFSFDHIAKALTESDIQGVFNDLLQLFLTALFRYQEVEPDPVEVKNKKMPALDNLSIDQATDVAQIFSTWPQKYHGALLRNLSLDSFSVTEILRLHLLSSGCWQRVSWQGVATPSEDPGLFFKIEEADLLKKLEEMSVFELNCEERCKVLSVLMHQLLANDVFKCAIDESADNTKPLRNQLKELRVNFARKLREDSMKKKDPKEKDDTNKEEGSAVNSTPSVDDEEKENSQDLTPEEKEALEEKKAKDAARLKTDFQRKEREMESQLRKLQLSFNLTPIGKDRAYRRYWIFQNVAGLFVEDDDPYKGVCLPKPVIQLNSIAVAAAKTESSPANIKKYLMQTDTKNGSSDKENEILRDIAIVQSELPFPSKNRKLSDLNPRVDFKKSNIENNISQLETCLQCVNKNDNQENFIKYCPHSKSNLSSDQCSANIDTCSVHNMNAPRTKWAFYYKEEELEALLMSLNNRGFRERALKEALVGEKERIRELFAKCPSNSFNKSLPQQTEQVRKSQRHQNSLNSSYAGMAPQDALELTLRDMILELEQRIYAGGLGCLKIGDREAWRGAIEQGANRCAPEIKEELSLKEDIEADILKLSLPVPLGKVIKDLAKAMFELSQGIEAKYLNPPLGESDEQKKARQKQQQQQEEEELQQRKKKSPIPLLESWQESLMQCTSLSQLFLYLGTLERSVAWSRSVLKAHCRICRRRGDAENMLLCDGCNRGHHIYCLKPPLKAIPEGDWFCISCRPAEIPVTPTKKSKKVDSDEEEEDEEEDDEEEDEEDEEEEDEEEMEEESDAEVDEEEDESEGSADESAVPQEACEACGDVGILVCCDGCPLMYHQECVNLKRIPRGDWLCPKCTKKEEAIKKAQKHPSNGSYGTRSSKLSDNKKKSNPTLKTKMGSKAPKRKYEDSFEEEFEPPSKKARNSAQNAARRRSKTGDDSDMLDYKACIDMLVELMKHPSSWPFLVPVSKKDAPGYHQKIKKPMDFGTIRSNLNYMKYKNNQEFVHDLYLVLHNCWLFNPKSSPEFKAADVLQKEIKRLLKEYEINNTSPFNGHYSHNMDDL